MKSRSGLMIASYCMAFFLMSSRICFPKIVPEKLPLRLLFERTSSGAEHSPSAPRDFTLDADRNIYIFDYMTNRIFKFDPAGALITAFGGKGEGENDFRHLTNIAVSGNQLHAIDSVAMFSYSLNGDLVKKTQYTGEALLEFPRYMGNGRFVGEKVLVEELKNVLTLRGPDGRETCRLAAYDLKTYFPRLKEGEDFFVDNTYAPGYLYDIRPDGAIAWARSDRFVIHSYQNGESRVWITGTATAIPFPPDERETMKRKRESIAKTMPSLHLYVPAVYPIVQQLFTGGHETWIYLASRERSGFIRYDGQGREAGFFTPDKDLDMMKARIHIFANTMYVMIPQRGRLQMYTAPVPKGNINP